MNKKELEKLLEAVKAVEGAADKLSDNSEIKEEIKKLLKSSSEPPTLKIKQIEIPENWLEQVSEAKVQHDKWGVVCVALILPLAWSADFRKKVLNDELRFVEPYNGSYMMWGANIFFGPIDEPVAGGDDWV